jgi:long-chain acyl-CoA synthetase
VFGPVHRKFGGRLRFLVSGGAPLEPEVEAFWSKLGLEILQGYGLTETSPCLTIARPGEVVQGSVGQFLDSVEHRFGEDGELQVRGPNVFGGYLEDPETTAQVFDGDWFRTGDIGEVRNGHLFLKGRSKELIKTPGGLNVYPDDVEGALRKVEGVRDACVFPLKGPSGEEVGAALLAQPGHALDPRSVTAEANKHLEAGRGVARAVVWPDDDFPRTPTMKVKKFQVRKAVEEGSIDGGAATDAGPDDPVLASIVKLARRPADEIDGAHRLGDDLGLDSLDLVDLVSALEDRLHIDLDEGEVAPETTVDELRTMLKERKGVKDERLPSWPRSAPALAFRWCFQHLLMLPLFRWFCRVEVHGLENIRDIEGPVIFAPNHLSHLDTPAIFHALPAGRAARTGAAAWKEYFEPESPTFAQHFWLPPVRLLMTVGLPMVPVAQSRGFRRSLRNIGTMLDGGWSLIFYPEGERVDSGIRKPFRQGIGIVGGAMRAQVIPVRVRGFNEILPRDTFWPKRGSGSVTFGKPLVFRSDDIAGMTRQVEEAVDAL